MLIVFLLVVAVGIYVLLHSASFHNYVLRTAQQKASESLNTRVTAQDFAVDFSKLGLDLYDVTIYGAGPARTHRSCRRITSQLACVLSPPLRRQWNLDNVVIDHPVVHLIVDQNGNTNFADAAGQQQQF